MWLTGTITVVQKFSRATGCLFPCSGEAESGPGSLNHPTSVAVDQDGDVYVVDWMNERIVIYDSDAKILAYLHGDAVDLSTVGPDAE